MNEKLKPCPFCGNYVCIEKRPLWSENGRGYQGCYEYVVKCDNPRCGCRVNLIGNDTVYNDDDKARKNAIRCWNTRRF